jgi:acylphosphatase
MGGFEQKNAPAVVAGDRVAVLVKPASKVESLPDVCRGLADELNLLGVMYSVGDRLEVVAEGERANLDTLVSSVESTVSAVDGTDITVRWQQPNGGYVAGFPLVMLQPKMTATITLGAKEFTLDYYTRHLQVEAVFNRGLKMAYKRVSPAELVVEVKGDSSRLKAFVRWAQRGPPLERADSVTIQWTE